MIEVKGKNNVYTRVIAHSISETGNELMTLEIQCHRFIWSEFMTHRCLVGSTVLTFDGNKKDKSVKDSYKMTLKDFYEKFSKGVKPHKPPRLLSQDLSVINPDTVYSASELAKLMGNSSPSSIRTSCRLGELKVQNKDKKRNVDWSILGSDYIKFRNDCESNTRTFTIKDRLKNMNLRMYNEDTKELDHTTVTDCWYVGEKPVFEMVTDCGRSVTTTDDHLILTGRGWLELKDILVGDTVITTTRKAENTIDGYIKVDGVPVSRFNRNVIKTIAPQQDYKCGDCDKVEKLEIHHIVPVHVDKSKALDPENCVALCNPCHKKRHKIQGWQKGSLMRTVESKVVSITPKGTESVYDISVDSHFHNFFANDIVVHNCKSRNAESTRAIPLQTSINTMYDVPAIPIKFTAKSKGMQSHVECNEPITYKGKQYTPTEAWLQHMDDTAELVRAYDRGGYHKQHVGRLLEPFKMIKAVVSATEWDNFLILRYESETEYSAQIEIHELADCMLKAKSQSVPVLLKHGEWHTPYYADGYWKPDYDIEYTTTTFGELVDIHGVTLKDALKISSSCCAQVSYRKLDDTLAKALDVYDKLVMSQPRHYSAVEHCGTPCKAHPMSSQSFDPANWDNGVTHVDIRGSWWSGNFKEWVQYRQVLMFDLNEKYTTYNDWTTNKENLE